MAKHQTSNTFYNNEGFIFDAPGSLREYIGEERDVIIPEGTAIIRACCFSGNSKIETIIIPDTVTVIEGQVFMGCVNLKRVVLPKFLDILGFHAFSDCAKLEFVEGLQFVDLVQHSCFYNTPYLEKLALKSKNGLVYIANHLYYLDKAIKEADLVKDLVIKEGTTVVDREVFCNCKYLRSVILPDSMMVIAENAFSNCTSLEYVKFNQGLSMICEYAFSNCPRLSGICIPNTVRNIGSFAFCGCDVNSLCVEHTSDLNLDNFALSWYTPQVSGEYGGVFNNSVVEVLSATCQSDLVAEFFKRCADYNEMLIDIMIRFVLFNYKYFNRYRSKIISIINSYIDKCKIKEDEFYWWLDAIMKIEDVELSARYLNYMHDNASK